MCTSYAFLVFIIIKYFSFDYGIAFWAFLLQHTWLQKCAKIYFPFHQLLVNSDHNLQCSEVLRVCCVMDWTISEHLQYKICLLSELIRNPWRNLAVNYEGPWGKSGGDAHHWIGSWYTLVLDLGRRRVWGERAETNLAEVYSSLVQGCRIIFFSYSRIFDLSSKFLGNPNSKSSIVANNSLPVIDYFLGE